MANTYRLMIGSTLFGLAVACAPVKFEKNSQVDKCQNFSETCVNTGSVDTFDYTVSVGGGKVDILVINDNSASMSTEQAQMANRFPTFLANLDSKSLDYRIGIITTDVSSDVSGSSITNLARPINQNGALQNANLIRFSNGQDYLTPDTLNKSNLFNTAIRRQETLDCESYLQSNASVGQTSTSYLNNCPSPDERGIFALNLFLKNNPSNFIREGAHLAVIILSDEDVRSSLYDDSESYVLRADDLPQTVLSNLSAKYGSKTMSFHSLIVKPGQLNGYTVQQVNDIISQKLMVGSPNGLYQFQQSYPNLMKTFFTGSDSSCLTTQSSQINNVSGSYGYLYHLLTKMTDGVEGTICVSNANPDYGSQLTSIGNNIGEHLNEIQLACSNPVDLEISFLQGNQSGYSVNGNIVVFNNELGAGTQVRVQYTCETL